MLKLLELKKHLVEHDDENVTRLFADVFVEREKLMAGAVGPVDSSPELPTLSENMRAFFVGDLLARKGKALLQQYEKDPLRQGKRK